MKAITKSPPAVRNEIEMGEFQAKSDPPPEIGTYTNK